MEKYRYKDFLKIKDVDVQDIEAIPCVYFLMYNKYVCYVGMTMDDLHHRLFPFRGKEGHFNNKKFNRIKIIDCSGKDRTGVLKLESYFIKLFNPYYNIIGKHNIKVDEQYLNDSKKDKNDLLNILKEQREKKADLVYDLMMNANKKH